jgi:hypothetical protein
MRSSTVRAAAAAAFVALLLIAPTASAQVIGDIRLPMPTARIELAGPRVGVTWLEPGVQRKLADRDIDVSPMISQFGWQFERHFLGVNEPISPIMEFVVLVGGLDQGVFLPSLTWLVGLRGRNGAEIGVGPNLTPAGTALAIAAGVTIRQRTLNIPLHFALVPSASGMRVSALTGFTMR